MNQRSIFELSEENHLLNEADKEYLGPKSKFVGYSTYIKSYAWRKKRDVAFKKLGRKCQNCGIENIRLDVHHKHYKTLYHERIQDIEILCEKCHKKADRARVNKREEEAYENAFVTWATSKYGEECLLYMDEMKLWMEFDEWIEKKEYERFR